MVMRISTRNMSQTVTENESINIPITESIPILVVDWDIYILTYPLSRSRSGSYTFRLRISWKRRKIDQALLLPSNKPLSDTEERRERKINIRYPLLLFLLPTFKLYHYQYYYACYIRSTPISYVLTVSLVIVVIDMIGTISAVLDLDNLNRLLSKLSNELHCYF